MAGWGRTLASVLPILCMTCVASPLTLRAQEAPPETPRLPGSPVPINRPAGDSSGPPSEPGVVSPKAKAAPVPASEGPHPLQLLDSGVLPGQSPAAAASAVQESPPKPGASVEAFGKQLTAVTGLPDFRLFLGGLISADFYYNSARPVAPGIPFFLTPGPAAGFDQQTFDANARGTLLFGLFSGPRIGDFETRGVLIFILFNDALIVDRYGILPIQAYGQLKNDHWRFAAGLQFDIFNPLNPTTLPFSVLGGSGNAGAGFPGQVRAERYLRPFDDSQVTLTVGLSEPIPTTVNPNLRISEDNGWPTVEGRAALALGPLAGEGPLARRPFEWGVSGVVGQIRTTEPGRRQIVADVWGMGSDFRWRITDRFGIQGEVFLGQTLGMYTAGILQNINLLTLQGLHAAGGWAEVYYYLCPEKLHTHIGYGIDDPLDRDLAPLQPVRNETYFANLIWDVTKYFRIGGEVTFRKTAYTVVPNNDGVGFHMQTQWKF